MEEYVNELSRNLPEPAAARVLLGEAQSRDVLLLAVELRRYARTGGSADPRETLAELTADLERVTTAIARGRGLVEVIAGHRVLARFEGESRGHRALSVAARILESGTSAHIATGLIAPGGIGGVGADTEAPAVALASGRAITGPVTWGERAERALVGLPVQQIESLLREATPGEILMSREVHDELKGAFEAAGYRLAPRRGVITPQPLYVIGAQMAAQLTGGTSGSGAQAMTMTPPRRRHPHRHLAGGPAGSSASRSSRCSAPAAWGSSTRRATASWTTWSPSRC